jgi:class 3 adenylate cyclase/tetratricopeptide (TPR) repeat protein
VSGAKFCVECGSSLATACAACGHATEPGQNFCSECGAALSPRSASTSTEVRAGSAPEIGPAAASPRRDAAELRTVTVLFVDLVGYTSLSELLDPEDVRDLLGHYFDAARRIVSRYGGTIEKFIGDAVMAVWGTPVAREDDVERAVRAALEIVDAVTALRHEVQADDLQARAGVVTGQAALVAKPEEGVVVGDRVNTAARVQAAAEPGTVLVDDITRQVTSTVIAYEDAGHHELKGKADPMHLWRAVEVVSDTRGLDGQGLHARFVGRDADLRLAKELLHVGISRRSVRLVAVSGPAGVGKSRLGAEFFDYLMQLPDGFLWHPGRCLPYGDGVAYWALAEMVRHRLGLAEDAPFEETQAKLSAGVERWVEDVAEREFISHRLGILLGVADPGPGREELFAGWRLFFERLSEHAPVVMAFEDMHWADDGLLDFVEYLLDWSAQHRIFILTFARPELSERRPGWPAGHRSVTAMYLDPLGEKAMEDLLDSVATLPAPAKRRIISHAEGIPLYAIETVRALADRGALIERDGALVLAGELGELDVPPSLISLLGARLDALAPDEREMVKMMSVFGGNFPLAAAQALSGLPARAAAAVLTSLVRKQVLSVRSDPLSPDRGQYRFAQILLRTVAYDMLSKRERKARHLAAGEYLSRAFANEGEDVAEAVAAHYLQAYRCATGGEDAERLRAEAVAALRRGAQRAAGVGAPLSAERAYRRAIELAGGDDERIELIEAAGDMALVDGRYEDALELFEDAVARLTARGRVRDAAGLATKIGHALRRVGRATEAIDRMRRGLAVLSEDGEERAAAQLNVELGVALLASGQVRAAAEPLERALELAQAHELSEVLAGALTYKAQLCVSLSRPHEARLLFDGAIDLCRRQDLSGRLIVALLNSGDFLTRFDLPGAEERMSDALAAARRTGSRVYEGVAASNLMRLWEYTGAWDAMERLGAELLDDSARERPGAADIHSALAMLAALRGATDAAQAHLAEVAAWRHSESDQHRWTHMACEAVVALAGGDPKGAFELVSGAIRDVIDGEGPAGQASRIGFPCALEAALKLGRAGEAGDLLALLAERPPGQVPPFLRAQVERGRGLLAVEAGDRAAAHGHFTAAIALLSALEYPYWLARVRTDLGSLLLEEGRSEEARGALEEAIAALGQLRAAPALARADAVLAR